MINRKPKQKCPDCKKFYWKQHTCQVKKDTGTLPIPLSGVQRNKVDLNAQDDTKLHSGRSASLLVDTQPDIFFCETCGEMCKTLTDVSLHSRENKHYEFRNPLLKDMRLMIA